MPTLRAAALRLVLAVCTLAGIALAGARDYRAAVSGGEVASAAFPGLDEAIGRELRSLGAEGVADRRLAQGAENLAAFMVAQDPLRRPMHADRDDLVRAAGTLEHRCGFAIFSGSGALPSTERILAAVRSAASKRTEKSLLAYGVGVARSGGEGGRFVVVLAQAERFVAFDDAVPRVASVGTRLRLRGRGLVPLGAVTASILGPSGLVRLVDLGKAETFALDVPLDAPGTWRIELSGELRVGPFPVVNFPVYVGVPDAVDAQPAAPLLEDPVAFARALLGLVNETRARHGRVLLALDPRLERAAAQHADAMIREHFLGHDSPRTGSPRDRVQREGLVSGLVGENIGVGATPREVHEGLLASPGHRATLLDPSLTHVGFGLALEPISEVCGEGARACASRAWVVTEDFARLNPVEDPAAVRERVLRAVGEARAARGISLLVPHSNLAAAAAAIAARVAREHVASEALATFAEEAIGRLCGKGRPARTRVLSWRVDDPMRVAESPELVDPRVDLVGLGLAQTSAPGEPENRWSVVALVAQGSLPKVDRAARTEELVAQAREGRRAAGLGDLLVDPKLQAAAAGFAATLAAGGEIPKEKAFFAALGLRVHAARVQQGTVDPDSSIASWGVFRDEKYKVFGVGFAQGTAPGGTANAHHVVVVGAVP